MKIAFHDFKPGFISPFQKKYLDVLTHNNIEYMILDINEADFWQKLQLCSHFIYNWGHASDHHQTAKAILPVIENYLDIPCFPDQNTCWLFDDKIKQYYLFKSLGFPVIESWIYWDREKAGEFINRAEFPLIFKLKNGAGSYNIIYVADQKHALRIVKKMFGRGVEANSNNLGKKINQSHGSKDYLKRKFRSIYKSMNNLDVNVCWEKQKNYILFQKFLPANNYDTRVVIMGAKAFAFQRFNRENDFRASGSNRKNLNYLDIDLEMVKLAFQISEICQFQSMAYDFIYDQYKKPALIEASYAFPDKTLPYCPGYWDRKLNWHEGHYWPQYIQLAEFLNRPDLKQPKFE